MFDLALARAIHVLSIVVWIGGVSMITLQVLPAARRGELGADAFKGFEAVERRFSAVARLAVLGAGASGLYMTARLDAFARFSHAEFWWMHAMVLVWLIFAFLLFVGEPLFFHRVFADWGRRDPQGALRALIRVHRVLLALSFVAIFGAVAGSQGWSPF